MMFLLFGKITTCCAFMCSTASNNSAVDGFIVCPPVTTPCTFICPNNSANPSPLHTATTAQFTGGNCFTAGLRTGVVLETPNSASRCACSSATSSNKSVTRILNGFPPNSNGASIAAPMSLVCTWQLYSPSPPTTTIESPILPHASINAFDFASSMFNKNITS